MAVIANTFQSTSANVNRQELADVVSRIDPEDTPIYSLIPTETCKTTHPEWVQDELAPPGENIQLEGDEYTFLETTPAIHVGNYTQILRKSGIISNTQNATDNAANVEQVKYQKLKKGVELRKDVEFAIVSTQASVAGATRVMGSLPTWIETNANRGATGTNGGFNPADGLTDVPGNGTQRAFTKDIMDNVMQQGYQNGANFRHLVVSPYIKSVFVTFMSDGNVASFRYAAENGQNNSIVANADVYEGPFGKVMVHPNRVMAEGASPALRARNAFFIDTEHLSFAWFRKIMEDKDIAKTGDAKKFVLIGEGTLKVKNEKGLGVAADLFGLTSGT